jgi:hypothetical protein
MHPEERGAGETGMMMDPDDRDEHRVLYFHLKYDVPKLVTISDLDVALRDFGDFTTKVLARKALEWNEGPLVGVRSIAHGWGEYDGLNTLWLSKDLVKTFEDITGAANAAYDAGDAAKGNRILKEHEKDEEFMRLKHWGGKGGPDRELVLDVVLLTLLVAWAENLFQKKGDSGPNMKRVLRFQQKVWGKVLVSNINLK